MSPVSGETSRWIVEHVYAPVQLKSELTGFINEAQFAGVAVNKYLALRFGLPFQN